MRLQCTISDCQKPQVARGMCAAHYHHALMAEPRPPCSVDGCEKPSRTKGLCNSHYVQAGRTGGDPTGHLPRRQRAVCTIDGCGEPAVGRGYCTLHWVRWRKHGDPLTVILQSDKRTQYACAWCGKPFYAKPSAGTLFCSKSCSKRKHATKQETARLTTHRYRTRKRSQFVADVSEQAIFDRDKGLCGICGKPVERSKMSLDHILPISKGGTHEPRNVRLAHANCNKGRGNRGQAQLRLLP